jgi:hypothetical protein
MGLKSYCKSAATDRCTCVGEDGDHRSGEMKERGSREKERGREEKERRSIEVEGEVVQEGSRFVSSTLGWH